ncbi:methyltransferase domain-containing protein [Candidatus Neomarinimicrobiota bacterium]
MAYTRWKDLDAVEKYARSRYRHWDQKWVDLRERSMVRRILRKNAIKGPILDAPVGYGRFQPLLREFGRLTALDLNYYAALYQPEILGLCDWAINGSCEALPFRDNTFETIFSFRLLQHMHEPVERINILREFARVSKRWVIVSAYIGSPLHRLHRILVPQPSKITILDNKTFYEEAKSAGLRPIKRLSLLRGFHAHRIFLCTTDSASD